MTAPIAITGTFADLKSVKTRSVVQLIIECPIENAAAIIAAFGFPQPGQEIPVAVARLDLKERSGEEIFREAVEQSKGPRRWPDLPPSQQAAIRCGDQSFLSYLALTKPTLWAEYKNAHGSDIDRGKAAVAVVRWHCGVESRAEIKPGTEAAQRWHELEKEYQAWLTIA